MFFNFKSLLKDRLQQQGIDSSVEAAMVASVFRRLVAEKFGKSAADGLRRIALINDDTIEVATSSAPFASELKMNEFDFKDALAQEFKGKQFRLRIFG